MKLIKLNAIDSTNSFLKELSKNSLLENYTVVATQNQTNGRGQQEGLWFSEPFKNLTFSVFLRDLDLEITNQKYLNFAISLAVFEVLKSQKIPSLCIKWPNDILSVNKKICGILIENTIQNKMISSSIVGIGLNVNQEFFDKTLKKVTSLKNITNIEFNLDDLLFEIVNKIKGNIKLLSTKKFDILQQGYCAVLFKINTTSMFKNPDQEFFMGIIRGISSSGNILIELEDETIKEFGVKEISFA